MLPKENRLNKREIEKVLKRGRSFDTSFFRLKGDFGKKPFKISPVVSKKVSKLAVDRNNIKRYIFNIIKDLDLEKESFQGVLFVKKDISKISRDILKEDILGLFKK